MVCKDYIELERGAWTVDIPRIWTVYEEEGGKVILHLVVRGARCVNQGCNLAWIYTRATVFKHAASLDRQNMATESRNIYTEHKAIGHLCTSLLIFISSQNFIYSAFMCQLVCYRVLVSHSFHSCLLGCHVYVDFLVSTRMKNLNFHTSTLKLTN